MNEHRDPEAWAKDLEDAFGWRPMDGGDSTHESCIMDNQTLEPQGGHPGCPDPETCPVGWHEVEVTVKYFTKYRDIDQEALDAAIRGAVKACGGRDVEVGAIDASHRPDW